MASVNLVDIISVRSYLPYNSNRLLELLLVYHSFTVNLAGYVQIV